MTNYRFDLRPGQAARLQRQIAEQRQKAPSSTLDMRLFEGMGWRFHLAARVVHGFRGGPKAPPAASTAPQTTPAAPAVQPATTAAPALDLSQVTLDADGWSSWIGWAGGECPVPRDHAVFVRVRDGAASGWPSAADSWDWWHLGGYEDVTAFRVQARAASDTEGLEPGVYRVFVASATNRYSKWTGNKWFLCCPGSKLAAEETALSPAMTLQPGARYLPIKVVV